MVLQVTGVSYRSASTVEREKALTIFRALPGIPLATCNRVELYQIKNGKLKIENGGIYYYENEDAVRHLFRVASGLDSQILGETEILGQVKEAYLKSRGQYWLLDKLFERAVLVGRKVRAQTGISRGNVSAASVAVSKAITLLGDEKAQKKILLIGAGKVTESVLKILLKADFSFVLVANRTYEKAQALAGRLGGRAIRFTKLREELRDADLVISSTAAPHIVMRAAQVGHRDKPLLIMDLAVPRNVDPAVAAIPRVTLLNIDDIKEAINLNLTKRKLEAVFAERLIEEEVREFCGQYVSEAVAVN